MIFSIIKNLLKYDHACLKSDCFITYKMIILTEVVKKVTCQGTFFVMKLLKEFDDIHTKPR